MLKRCFYSLFITGVATSALLQAAALPAVTATVEQTTQRPDGSSSVTASTFYRDSRGRTREEGSNGARIYDPVSGVAITLDLAGKRAHVLRRAAADHQNTVAAQVPPQLVAGNGKVLKPYVDNTANLGPNTIDGNAVIGERHSVEYPPGVGGSIRFRRVTTERWISPMLGLTVMSTVSDSLNKTTVTRYRNIVINPSVDPTLFEIPRGFQVFSR
jgi:hypothetical protein